MAVILVIALTPSVWAQTGTITDGTATFAWTGSTTTEGQADFSAGGGDYVYQNWWWFRVEGGTAETPLPWAGWTPPGPDVESYTGGTATLGWDDGLAPFGDFTAELAVTIDEVAAGVSATVVEAMTITNTGSDRLRLSLFNYLDVDVMDSSDDTAELVAPNHMRIADEDEYVEFLGVGADAYQVLPWNDLLAMLQDGAVTDLDSTGLPFGPGDFSGAFQWDLELAPGASMTVIEGLSINTDAVPEPSMLVMMALGGAIVIRRRGAAGGIRPRR
jgi:hypothetical protein